MLGAVRARSKDIPITSRRSQSESGLRATGRAREIVDRGGKHLPCVQRRELPGMTLTLLCMAQYMAIPPSLQSSPQ